MSISHAGTMTAQDYEDAAWEYYRTLPMEHFMEATPQAMQKEIMLESMAILKNRRPEVQYFSELLVQYEFQGVQRNVVPDNMVVLSTQPFRHRSSFPVKLEPAPPFGVLEWVSARSEGKDYEDSFRKYEQELKVPYCLMFHPAEQDLRMNRMEGDHYVLMEADTKGRRLIPELELGIGLLDGWVRFWYRDELLPLTAELDRKLTLLAKQVEMQSRQLVEKDRKLETQSKQLEIQSKQLEEKDDILGMLQAGLRQQVESRASQLGRTDILQALSSASSIDLLNWLKELG